MDSQLGDVSSSLTLRPDDVKPASPPASSSSTLTSFWNPLSSFFSSREEEQKSQSTTRRLSSAPPVNNGASQGPISNGSNPPSIASKFLSSLASVFGVRGVQGAIHVGFDVTSPAFGSPTHTISSHYSFDITEAVHNLDPHIQGLIVSYLLGNGVPAPAPSHSPQPESSQVQVDEGFVYMQQSHSGMQSDAGDYILYGHVAISADLHQQLLTSGIKPSQLQEALDKHDSDPDRAIDWLLSNTESKREITELETRVTNLQMIAQAPFDLQLLELPSFLSKMKVLTNLEIAHHSLTSIPTHFIFSLPSLETLKLRGNGLKYFLTSETQPSSSLAASTTVTKSPNEKRNAQAQMYTTPFGGPTHPVQSAQRVSAHLADSAEELELNAWKYQDHEAMITRWGAPKLMHLDLSDNALTSLPSHLSILSNLTYCNLSNNYLKSLPEEMTLMPIQTLLVSANQVYDLPIAPTTFEPSAIRMYSSLSRLDIDNNGIKPALLSLNSRTVLQNLMNYRQLKSLCIAGNPISVLPASLMVFAGSLVELDASKAGLKNLAPQELKTFANIRKLNLSASGLKTLPVELNTLSKLEELDLSDNELTTLPHGLPGLRFSLVKLNLARNRLKAVPSGLCTLVNLTWLDMSSNQLNDLVLDIISPLTALRRLDLGSNYLTKFPSSLSTLGNLTFLSLRANPLLQVNALPHFGNLEELDLNETPTLVSLPKLCAELSELKTLHVAHVTLSLVVKRYKHRVLSSLASGNRRTTGHMQRHVTVLVHNSDSLGLIQLISLLRSCPHELLLGGMAQLCMDSNWHSKLLQAGLVNELAFLLFSSSELPNAQIRTLKAIQTLCKNPGNHNFIGIDKQVIACLKDILQNNLNLISSAQSTDPSNRHLQSTAYSRANLLVRIALDAFCYLSYDASIRHMINQEQTSSSLASILGLLKNANGEIDSTAVNTSSTTTSSSSASSTPTKERPEDTSSTGPSTASIHQLDQEYGLCAMIRHISLLKHDDQLSLRAKRAMAGLGLIPPIVPNKRPRGIRILSIDGGGTRGFIVLHMLAVLEALTGQKISKLFDLIVGTSTGGMITGLAAWSPIPMEEAKPFYKIMCKTVFTPKGQNVVPPSESVRTNGPTPVPPLFAGDEEDEGGARVYGSSTDVLSSLGSTETLRSSLGDSLADSLNDMSRPPEDGDGSSSSKMDTTSNGTSGQNSTSWTAGSNATSNSNSVPSAAESRWLSSAPWQKFTGLISMIQTRSYYETGPIESILKEMAGESVSMLDTAMMSDTKFALACARVNMHPPQPYILRNYNHPEFSNRPSFGSHASPSSPSASFAAPPTFSSPLPHNPCSLPGNATFRVWEAIRATSAAPGYFDPVVKDDLHLVDGAILYNNPVALAIREARSIWPDAEISTVVSCGTGSRPSKLVDVSMGQLLSAVVDSATETEKTALLAAAALPAGRYFRLQPCDDVFDFPIDETRPERFDEMERFMKKWIEENGNLFASIVAALTKEE